MSHTANHPSLEKFTNRTRKLYSLPAVALKVLKLMRQKTVDTQSLKECIEHDPALAGKILRVVNSALFGLSEPVADLNQALALLGTKTLKLLVLGFSLPTDLFSNMEAAVLEHYWRHTLIKSVAAREISEHLFQAPGDEAFLAGLLQDIGLLALAQDLKTPYLEFLNKIFEANEDLALLERETLGFDHRMLSAAMLENWGLPPSLAKPLAVPFDRHTIAELPLAEQRMPKILHLADLVADFLGFQRLERLNQLLDVGQAYRRLALDQLEDLLESLETKVPQLAEVLSVQWSSQADYRQILLDAYQQLSEVADDAAESLCQEQTPSRSWLQSTDALQAAVSDRLEETERAGEPLRSTPSEAPVADPAVPIDASSCADAESAAMSTEKVAGPVATDEHGLLTRVRLAVSRCRQGRRPVSLVLAEIDEFDLVLVVHGVDGAAHVVHMLAAELETACDHEPDTLQVGEHRLAVFLEGYDRPQAVAVARHAVNGFREWSAERGNASISVSIGVATLPMPPRNFPCNELIEAAERCLFGVQLCGGDGIKSIDIY